ncbi:hypothetical protein AVDCRST_MAG92-4038 [uncultured Coleofasciculus sp.]|uniref:Uncharacterized protein n=1 Tax=uncultured Coleofasciculus sp. TaxID=1267456 RepID=A0A6J4JU26_9CYAN|nr:hypothetical protein AVDCRST_MAG92-4038 [uncultured Coleofasciculus sp.]
MRRQERIPSARFNQLNNFEAASGVGLFVEQVYCNLQLI